MYAVLCTCSVWHANVLHIEIANEICICMHNRCTRPWIFQHVIVVEPYLLFLNTLQVTNESIQIENETTFTKMAIQVSMNFIYYFWYSTGGITEGISLGLWAHEIPSLIPPFLKYCTYPLQTYDFAIIFTSNETILAFNQHVPVRECSILYNIFVS